MTLAASSWALNEAPLENPTEAAVLFAMADRAGDDGRGVFFSNATLAAKARISERTVQRTLAELERRGVIRRGDQSAAAYLPANRRPVVWDLVMPNRRTRLTPRGDNLTPLDGSGVTDRAVWGDRSSGFGVTPVADNTSTKTRTKTAAAAVDADAPGGCAAHQRRMPACPDCQRVIPRRTRPRETNPGLVAEVRKTLRGSVA